ncbi:MAG TPA: MXAN_6640 family putative metalloprotease [Marmoricola sp.]|nr:MXAN_6640 family putative metalloprotease [Marmoricola sp.]
MRPFRTAAIGLVVACAVTALPVGALAEPGGGRVPVPNDRSSAADEVGPALAALEAVDDAFRGGPASARRTADSAHPDRRLTLLLRDLRLGLEELDGEERDRAESYLARPDGDRAFPDEPLYDEGVVTRDDCTVAPTPGSHVCVHWVTSTRDAPRLDDGDGDGVPDQVETTRDVLNSVWRRIVDAGGYRPPLADTTSDNSGPDGKLDVYLADLGASSLYGYCATDDPAAGSNATVSAFCALDDDFSAVQFGGDPLENLQVTAAHEFFHAVQYAYDWLEDGWLLEGTAAWVEDELYDEVDDNLQYLPRSPLTDPYVAMDDAGSGRNLYGSWIFWRYLAERFPAQGGTGMPLVIRDVVDRLGGPGPTDMGAYSTRAMVGALSARHVSFRQLFSAFGATNRRPAAFYEEGAAYPAAPLALTMSLRNGRAKAVGFRADHLSNDTFRVVPGRALTGRRWKLRVRVEMPKRSLGYAATVTTLRKGGGVGTKQVRLAANGDGRLTTSFGRKRVKAVEVTLTNASVRYACWSGVDSPYACHGIPKDDGRPVKARVRAFR